MKTFTYTTRYKTILGDLHTPVSTYLKVRDIFPQSAADGKFRLSWK